MRTLAEIQRQENCDYVKAINIQDTERFSECAASNGSAVPVTFIAESWGYKYQWRVTSDVLLDSSGRPFVWAKPARRISDKQGRLRSSLPWYLTLIPPNDV